MFRKATLQQISFLLRQKSVQFTFYLLLLIVLYSYFSAIGEFHGMDLLEMCGPVNLLSISWDRANFRQDLLMVITMLYPVLAVCPAGFSLAREKASGEQVFLAARMGYRSYHFSKLTAAFAVTALVFMVPFFLELALNCTAFPLDAAGNLIPANMYNPVYIAGVRNFLFSDLYVWNPYVYAVVGILFLGFLSGLLGAFTVAFSSLVRVKYRIFLFLPVFLLLNATMYLNRLFSSADFSMGWDHYFFLLDEQPKSGIYLLFLILLLAGFSVLGAWKAGRRDCI